jgi:hypothetical protein
MRAARCSSVVTAMATGEICNLISMPAQHPATSVDVTAVARLVIFCEASCSSGHSESCEMRRVGHVCICAPPRCRWFAPGIKWVALKRWHMPIGELWAVRKRQIYIIHAGYHHEALTAASHAQPCLPN